jgi:SAM-dependent methyltransferase
MSSPAALSDEVRARTRERFAALRAAWERNGALRTLYREWYGRMATGLPDPDRGPWIELGSGPGFAREFLPRVELTDIVRAPWHAREVSAEALPYADGSCGAFLMLDVLHHLASPVRFFQEATRALRPGGRVVICEPYISALSYLVYHFLHPEPVALGVDSFADLVAEGKDPWDSNQAVPTLLFSPRRRAEWNRYVPGLAILSVERFAGLAYPLTGGFSGRPWLPFPAWRVFHRLEAPLVRTLPRLLAFRMLVVLEKR